MPINCKVLWDQTEEYVKIKVIFHSSINLQKVDIFAHKDYIKLNSSPFYEEIFLRHPVDESESKCKLFGQEVHFILKKLEQITWDQLTNKDIVKDKKIEIKKKIIEERQLENQKKIEEKAAWKADVKRNDMLKEIERETKTRDKVDNLMKLVKEEKISEFKKDNSIEKPFPQEKVEQGIRKTGTITVKFTERVFQTPKRESQSQLEEEWLKKQLEAKKVIGFVEEDLRPHERNPEWLMEKGNSFFEAGNYLGAISAYTTGIKLTPNCYQLYLNRAGAQFREKNYMRCAEDCSKALDLLKPAIDLNLKPRIQALSRRGAALCKLGLLREGSDEFLAAWNLDKTNQTLREDIDKVEEMIRKPTDSE